MRIEKRSDRSGFTLIELMITLTIIGILAAVAIPGYVGYRLKAERSVAWTNLQSIRLLQEQFYAENSFYAGPCANTAAVMAALPGFQPDGGAQDLYDYSITVGVGATPQTFTALASSNIAGRDPGPNPTDPNFPNWAITDANVTNF